MEKVFRTAKSVRADASVVNEVGTGAGADVAFGSALFPQAANVAIRSKDKTIYLSFFIIFSSLV